MIRARAYTGFLGRVLIPDVKGWCLNRVFEWVLQTGIYKWCLKPRLKQFKVSTVTKYTHSGNIPSPSNRTQYLKCQ